MSGERIGQSLPTVKCSVVKYGAVLPKRYDFSGTVGEGGQKKCFTNVLWKKGTRQVGKSFFQIDGENNH